jgi:hypothetical protein
MNGCFMNMLELTEVDKRKLRKQQAASSGWKDTNKLLDSCNIRALRGTGRSYAISVTRSLVIDHIVPPHASATADKKVPGGANCSMYGAITHGEGMYKTISKGRPTTYVTKRLRAHSSSIVTEK